MQPVFLNREEGPKREYSAADGYHVCRIFGVRKMSKLQGAPVKTGVWRVASPRTPSHAGSPAHVWLCVAFPCPGKRVSWWLSRARGRFGPFGAPRRFGHGARSCRGKNICAKCGSTDHVADICENEVKCANCDGEHPAYARACPIWKQEKEILSLRAKDNLSYPEAKKRYAFLAKGGFVEVCARFKAFVAIGDFNGQCSKSSKEVPVLPSAPKRWPRPSFKPSSWPSCASSPSVAAIRETRTESATPYPASTPDAADPAPRGTSIVSAPVPKKLLHMAGIEDCYSSARVSTATLGNFAKTTYLAIQQTYSYLTPDLWRERELIKSPPPGVHRSPDARPPPPAKRRWATWSPVTRSRDSGCSGPPGV
ncbi:hypothetical protein ISCGN_019091 [Ixodes scapularis]